MENNEIMNNAQTVDPAALLSELEALRRTLREKEAEEKRRAELAELIELFPEADPDELPTEVGELIAQGVPVAAAYALYERRRSAALAKAQLANLNNAGRSTGAIGLCAENAELSIEEIRCMSPEQIRRNYNEVIRVLGESGRS